MNKIYTLAGLVIVFLIFFGETFTVISFSVAIPILIVLEIAEWNRKRELKRIYPGRKGERQ